MKILLDHCVDRRLARSLSAHEVHTAAELGWEQLRNGELLRRAAQEGFGCMLTTDTKIRHQQNLARLPVSVFVLRARSNRLADLLPLVHQMERAIAAIGPGPQLIELRNVSEDDDAV